MHGNGTASPVPGTRLRGLLRRTDSAGGGDSTGSAGAGGERCDLCAQAVSGEHRHLLDAEKDAVLCSCGPCSLLFGQSAAGGRRYRLLPTRRRRLRGTRIDAALWARLGVPVGLAFFVRDEAGQAVTVGYPSPLGVTRSAVDAEVWDAVSEGYPELAGLADGVEALLVYRSRGADEHWIVPLDDCYRLAALVRTHWRGLSGGGEVHEHIEAFFAGLGGASADDRTG